jgi:UDP-N-acetylmuramate dehydrogenase
MKILESEPLSGYCIYRIGGPAAYLALPADTPELIDAVIWARAKEIKFEVIGHGANLLISDAGFDGLVISLRDFGKFCVRKGNSIIAGAGVSLSEVVRYACAEGLTGAENLAGIPGSVGGALRMNAGAFGTEIKDILTGANTVFRNSLKEEMLSAEDLKLSYRASGGLDGRIVLAAEFAFKEGDKEEIARRQTEIKRLRAEKHPLEFSSCGSVFKRTSLAPAGKLIEECGLKGKREGGAEISQKHANFIINKENAKAGDVLKLMELAKSEVLKRFGIALEEEVRFLGKM